jgi:hypothetical protein
MCAYVMPLQSVKFSKLLRKVRPRFKTCKPIQVSPPVAELALILLSKLGKTH